VTDIFQLQIVRYNISFQKEFDTQSVFSVICVFIDVRTADERIYDAMHGADIQFEFFADFAQ
jgi:ABC-type enterochelin transport system substrate-binding protein